MTDNLLLPGDPDSPGPTNLTPWEALVVDAVGAVIEFWGFKLNHGRVWALLYLRDQAMTALELQEALGLSKGAVSMVTRELEGWKVVHRVRALSESSWRFSAETDFKGMIGRVIATREAAFLAKVTNDLREAEKRAREDRAVPKGQLERIRRMLALAEAFGVALETFIATARLDVKGLGAILASGVRNAARRVRR
jgi:HTH-type transcriptional regulator, glycine betaine synthesis regulator